ncbi:hypothetical protein [Mesorhizobium sp. CAU 1741]|uniref:hypothetical protein n=1 Tax=Mesorhizobium sp. CAU 1741 TaxID=3140366 RepID=UPI00325A47DB
MRAAHLIRTILLLLAVATAMTACGRRPGTLSTPYEAALEARDDAEDNGEALPPEPLPPVEDKPFILDGLI